MFGIQLGVSINLFVRRKHRTGVSRIAYASLGEYLRKEEKVAYLNQHCSVGAVPWITLEPDERNTWLTSGIYRDFQNHIPLGLKGGDAVFGTYGLGVSTNRDSWAYNFSGDVLKGAVTTSVDFYNAEVTRWLTGRTDRNVDDFVTYDDTRISWSRDLKADLKRGRKITFSDTKVRVSTYRPFTKSNLFFDRIFNEEVYQFGTFLPDARAEEENRIICSPSAGARSPYWVFCTNCIPNLAFVSIDAAQCFPLYVYDEDHFNRRENITDWALRQFRSRYEDESITRLDIFHYVYAVLHHFAYRERYAASLRRELPRIPFAPKFWDFAKAGARLAELHVNYEQQPEHGLERIETPGEKLNWRVQKMRLSKDKSLLVYNDFLTLKGIPPQVFDYRLGNRSALEWVIDQYQVKTDKRSGITNDPNRRHDEQYILRLIGQVITVSLETMKIVKALPSLGIELEKKTPVAVPPAPAAKKSGAS